MHVFYMMLHACAFHSLLYSIVSCNHVLVIINSNVCGLLRYHILATRKCFESTKWLYLSANWRNLIPPTVMTRCNTSVERMEHYFLANEITDASKQRSILISYMGQKAYKILRNIVAPNKPTDVSFKNLVSAMTSHFSPPPSEIVQRFRFNSRVRKQGETVAAYTLPN